MVAPPDTSEFGSSVLCFCYLYILQKKLSAVHASLHMYVPSTRVPTYLHEYVRTHVCTYVQYTYTSYIPTYVRSDITGQVRIWYMFAVL